LGKCAKYCDVNEAVNREVANRNHPRRYEYITEFLILTRFCK
jgi:hypothetical protein